VGKISIDSVSVIEEQKTIRLFFSRPLSYIPVREETISLLEHSIRETLARRYRNYILEFNTDGKSLQELVPNVFRKETVQDNNRLSGTRSGRVPLVQRVGSEHFVNGLSLSNIALWPSHGWYYESKLDRWEWQRARLFSTVEDLFTRGFVLPYLVPMLENSGASVFLPVERDPQTLEVVVDNDRSASGAKMILPEGVEPMLVPKGFLLRDTLFSGENPFELGSSLQFQAIPGSKVHVGYFPNISHGEYGVYVSWQSGKNRSTGVTYSVQHLSGKTDFLVNQQMAGGTWNYLGTFRFSNEQVKGREQGVYVSLDGKTGETISVDAVRFGGGMGNVARRPVESLLPNQWSLNENRQPLQEISTDDFSSFSWKTSGRPRFMEGARYYLQYAGFPDTLVYNLNSDKNDYNDDYMSRGEWVNYLMGSPNGPQKDRHAAGLGIPIDLAFAFHTDAGVTPGDSVIGTLAIYSTWSDKGIFPNGSSRLASRDLSDLVQTQIVEDIKALYNPNWMRRGLWDRQYSEAWRPNVPTMLLELLSHQNLADMQFGLDPRFRFQVSRSIYKGMLRFLTSREGRDYVVQPLSPDHFAITAVGHDELKLSWQPVTDPLEPTANAAKYKIYLETNGNGFSEWATTSDKMLSVKPEDKTAVYKFKVTALNDGGESFPSEVLSAYMGGTKGIGLVVNAFDRISGPAWMDNGGKAGIEWWNDPGVADGTNLTFTGNQYNFNRTEPWLDDDNPGWGSSFADSETASVIGNSFDYTAIHGWGLFGNNGYSWVSVSDEVFCQPDFDVAPYSAVDIILGEEKTTPSVNGNDSSEFEIYTPEFMQKIRQITDGGGNILISGAYVGSDFAEPKDSVAAGFAKEILHFIWRTNHASRTGNFFATDYGKPWFDMQGSFNQSAHPGFYTVEAPDGIEPAGDGAFTIFRYNENNVSSGVAFRGDYKTVVLGFPVEAMVSDRERELLLRQLMHFFDEKSTNDIIDPFGATIRKDTAEQKIYLIFSADGYGEGANHILDVMKRKGVKGSFFLTGNFLRNPEFENITRSIIEEEHYLGPHSDKHLLYVPWENRDSLLITRDEFYMDLENNILEIERFGIPRNDIGFYLAPYEWYNRPIVEWTQEHGLKLVNFTPGIGTNADYTTPDMANYRSSGELMDRLWRFESADRNGLNGAILLIHLGTHPDRTDKFYHKLEQFIDQLSAKGYRFGRL
jgi:peptidoglycan/xylan/chitin deacetylase (PgdA/CDA1 family)